MSSCENEGSMTMDNKESDEHENQEHDEKEPAAAQADLAANSEPAEPKFGFPVPDTQVAENIPGTEASGTAEGSKTNSNVGKPRTLEQMMSLKPGEDERTVISKKISWILRHGAKKANVEIDGEGWVKFKDLLNSDILYGTKEERLLSIINESNIQKTRYELKEFEGGEKFIRAMSKSRRNTAGGRERRDRRRETEGSEREPYQTKAESGGDRNWRDREHREHREHREQGWSHEDGPTFEQQIQEGFRPVYQGEKVVAMVRYNETVRPGRRAGEFQPNRGRFDGKGEHKGKGKGKGKSYEGGDGEEDGKGEAKGDHYNSGRRADGTVRQIRWRVVNGRDAIVRTDVPVDSDIVGTLFAGTVVAQIGEDVNLDNGIIRMQMEAFEPQAGIKGWVTRSAEAAGGPIFFLPDRGNRNHNAGFRNRGKGAGPGKGRRPIGAGEGSYDWQA